MSWLTATEMGGLFTPHSAQMTEVVYEATALAREGQLGKGRQKITFSIYSHALYASGCPLNDGNQLSLDLK